MIFSFLPVWFPFVWALAIAIYWRFLWKEPVNHWLICTLVFAVNFFFFAWSFILFLIVAIVKGGILDNLMNKKEDGKGK